MSEKNDTWESRMAARAQNKPMLDFGPMPAELPAHAPTCCHEWRIDGCWGWQIFRTCDMDCKHQHHEGEVWMAVNRPNPKEGEVCPDCGGVYRLQEYKQQGPVIVMIDGKDAYEGLLVCDCPAMA